MNSRVQIELQRCDPDTSSLDMRPWYISIHSNYPFSTELSKNIISCIMMLNGKDSIFFITETCIFSLFWVVKTAFYASKEQANKRAWKMSQMAECLTVPVVQDVWRGDSKKEIPRHRYISVLSRFFRIYEECDVGPHRKMKHLM